MRIGIRPLKNSDAFIGQVDQSEQLPEYRVEMVCEKRYIKSVLKVLLENHPYQTPAYSVIEINTLADFI